MHKHNIELHESLKQKLFQMFQKKKYVFRESKTYLSPNSLSPYNEYVLLVITDYISNQKKSLPKSNIS